mgnify:CR=1 FL=1
MDTPNYDPQMYMAANKNNHTTSTKCQYHAAASKPMWLSGVKCPLSALKRQTAKYSTNYYMKSVKPSCHKKVCTIYIAGKTKGSMTIFISLKNSKEYA